MVATRVANAKLSGWGMFSGLWILMGMKMTSEQSFTKMWHATKKQRDRLYMSDQPNDCGFIVPKSVEVTPPKSVVVSDIIWDWWL